MELTEKLREKFGFSEEAITDVLVGLYIFARIAAPRVNIDVIKKDPKDNKILEIAEEVKTDYIVSGDKKHILPLKKYNKTRILTATDF